MEQYRIIGNEVNGYAVEQLIYKSWTAITRRFRTFDAASKTLDEIEAINK